MVCGSGLAKVFAMVLQRADRHPVPFFKSVGMNSKINFPKSGMGIDEGTVLRWLKAVGDKVLEGEVIVEIETAKAVQEVAAPVSGTLTQILVPEGQSTAVNNALGLIED